MGDRAVVHFHDGQTLSPAVYLHWGGSRVRDLLIDTKRLMEGRPADVEYTAARFVGIVHSGMPNENTSLGIWNVTGGFDAVRKDEYSHGDAGVFLVDVRDWSVECHGGYGLSEGDNRSRSGKSVLA